MSWWQTALSVVGTVGKVAGVLAGAGAGSRSAVTFDVGGPAEEQFLQLTFRKVNGAILAYNTSMDQAVQMAFETDVARGNAGAGVTLTIPAFHSLDVTQAFATMATDDLDAFTVRPSGTLNASGGVGGDPPTSSIDARGANLPATGSVNLGRFFQVNVSASDRTIQIGLIGGFILAGLVLLDIRGAGKTFCRITNIMKKDKESGLGDDNSIVVAIPNSVDIDAGIASIEIVAAVTSQSYLTFVDSVIRSGETKPITSSEQRELAALQHA